MSDTDPGIRSAARSYLEAGCGSTTGSDLTISNIGPEEAVWADSGDRRSFFQEDRWQPIRRYVVTKLHG